MTSCFTPFMRATRIAAQRQPSDLLAYKRQHTKYWPKFKVSVS